MVKPRRLALGEILEVTFDRMKSGTSVNPVDFETWDTLP
jgi:hypothetical protein